MKKKLILLTILTTIFMTGFILVDLFNKKEDPIEIKETTPKNPVPKQKYIKAGDTSYFKQIDKDNLVKIEIINETVAGQNKETITDQKEIEIIYNNIKSTNLGEEIEMVCNDYSTIYNFIDKNDKKVRITIECGEYMYLGNNGYEMEVIRIEDFD